MKYPYVCRLASAGMALLAAVALLATAAGASQIVPSPIIVDNTDPGFSASARWGTANYPPGFYGTNYRYRVAEPRSDPATWSYTTPSAADYHVYAWWPQLYTFTSMAPYIVYHSGGSTVVYVNQQVNGARWNPLGTFNLTAGSQRIQVSCWTATGYLVIADAVKISR